MDVDHIGVLVGDGSFPREQTIEKVREIFAAIPAGSKASALLLSHDLDLIVRITAALLPDIPHFGAAPQHLLPAQARKLKVEFPQISSMRSIPVVSESSVALARSYDGLADWQLPDGTAQIDRLGTSNVAPLIVSGQIKPALTQNQIQVIKETQGETSQLSQVDLDALVLYLKSLQ